MSESAWAAELIEAFRKEKPDAAHLAELASIAVRIDAPLLRALRHELWPQADPGAEADLWFGPLVQAHDREACVLHEAVLLKLREDLAKEPTRLRRAAQVVKQVHTYLPEASQLEEELTALALSGVPDVDARAEEALRPALRALASDASGDTAEHAQRALEAARWAMSAVSRLPPRVRESAAAHTLLLGAALRLEDPGIAAMLSEQTVPVESLSWLLPGGTSDSPAKIGVSLLPNGVRFEASETAAHAIELPETNPALVSVRWTTASQTHHRVVNAIPGTLVETGTTPVPIEIITLAGDVFRLTASGTPSASDSETTTEQLDQEVRLPPPLDCLVEVETLGSQGGFWIAIPVGDGLWITSMQNFGDTPFLAPHDDGSQFRVLNYEDKSTSIRVLKPLSPRSELPLSQDSEQSASSLLGMTESAALTIGTVQNRRGKFYAVRVIKATVERRMPALVQSSEAVTLNVIGAPLLNEGLLVGMVLNQTEGPVFEVASLKEINQVVARAKSIYESSKRLDPVRDEPTYPNRGSIYISHSSVDQELVRKVADRLISRGLHTFVDLTELKSDDPWEAKLRDAVRESALVLALVTPAFLKSEWAAREMNFALESKVPTILVLYHVTSTEVSTSSLASAANQLHFLLDERDLERSLDLLALQVENRMLESFGELPVTSRPAEGYTGRHDSVTAPKDDKWYDVQTKFDLANAYREMGDEHEARKFLQEVIAEGDSDQQAAAAKVLDEIKPTKKSEPKSKRKTASTTSRRRPTTTESTDVEDDGLRANAEFLKPLYASPALAAIVGSEALPRTEVTKRIWEYIKKQKLQDPVNKRMINADARLKGVLGGRSQVSLFEMTKLVASQLFDKRPSRPMDPQLAKASRKKRTRKT